MNQPLVLSLFPGIGLLDMAFEEEGFCVVRGPDVLWGGDIRRFHPPAGKFDGVIGGPPCQAFSPLASLNRSLGRECRYANLIPEFERCVIAAWPLWFLMENVERAPLPNIVGYGHSGGLLNNRWFGAEQNRKRRITFGHRAPAGRAVNIRAYLDETVLFENPVYESAVVSTRGYQLSSGNGYWARPATAQRRREAARRPITRLAELQGLPSDFLSDAPFTEQGKRRVIANGVPLPMGRAIARAVKRAMGYES